MAPANLDLALFAWLFTFFILMLLGVLASWGWAVWRLWLGIPLLDDVRPVKTSAVPWGGPVLAAVVLVYYLVSVSVVTTYQAVSGRHLPRAAKQAEKPVEPGTGKADEPARPKVGPPAPAARENAAAKNPADPALQSQLELMLQAAAINFLLLLLVPGLVMTLTGATLVDFGWDVRHWQSQVFHGARAGMLITPVVFAIQNFAVRIWPPQKHPLEEMVKEQFTPGAAVLAIVSAMVLAPLVEELLFRGLLQQWLTGLFCYPSDVRPRLEDDPPIENPAGDGLGSGEHRLWARETELEVGEDHGAVLAAIALTSALFAGMHYAQWPAPIAIFVLSLWLGTVYRRSGSLLSAIALHGTFNAFSTLMLLLEALSRKLAPEAPAAVFTGLLQWWL